MWKVTSLRLGLSAFHRPYVRPGRIFVAKHFRLRRVRRPILVNQPLLLVNLH